MKSNSFGIFISIVLLAFVLRFVKLGEIPYGLNIDEASMGYNAYSLLTTGKDRYGQFLPILFRSFNSFQSPLYTYFTVIPIMFFGLSVLSVHLVSAISGVGVVVLSFLIVNLLTGKLSVSSFASFFVAISPWSVFFSRVATEASLGIFLFLLGFYVFLVSVKKNIKLLPLSFLLLGLSTHAYYSERIISLLIIFPLTFYYRRDLLKRKMLTIGSLLILIFTQLPHLYISRTGAFARRLDQVTYLSKSFFDDNGSRYKSLPAGRIIFVAREFMSQYVSYFSPRNLFFESDEQEARSMPDISVFYVWMVVPFFVGATSLVKRKYSELGKILFFLLLVSPVPVAMAFDPFYTLRALSLFWGVTVVISVGVTDIFLAIRRTKIKCFVFAILTVISFFSLYKSLFVLDKYERAEVGGYSFIKLVEVVDKFPDGKFVVDSSRDLGTGIRFVFFERVNPEAMQEYLRGKMNVDYYSSVAVEESYLLGNVEVRPILWEEDIYKKQILVGDNLTFSEDQIKEHFLIKEFDILGMTGEVVLSGYSTNPVEKCASLLKYNPHCGKR